MYNHHTATDKIFVTFVQSNLSHTNLKLQSNQNEIKFRRHSMEILIGKEISGYYLEQQLESVLTPTTEGTSE